MTHIMRDADTGDLLGEATPAQRQASNKSNSTGQHGIILIDADGDVIAPSSWAATQPGTRKVYTEARS